MLAAVNDTPYKVFLVLHVFSAIAAFAASAVHPLLARQLRNGPVPAAALAALVRNQRRFHGPALIVTGILGFGLAGLSDEVYKLSQLWLILSFLAWVGANGVLHALVIPAEKAWAGGDLGGAKRSEQANVLLTLLLVVLLVLMIWKPGL
jgi:uncharacterized membrane protein